MKEKTLRLILRPVVRYLVGPGLLALGAFIPHSLLAGLAVGLGWLMVAGGNLGTDNKLRSQDARLTISMLLDHAVACFEAASPSPAERTLRAALLIVDEASDGLRIEYSTSGYSSAERSLIWTRGQGCVGFSWESARTTLAPVDVELPVSPSDADSPTRPWNVTADQIRLTAGRVASVIAVPIMEPPGSSNVVAVFAVDDRKGLNDSPLGNADVQPAVEQLAESFRRLIKKVSSLTGEEAA